MSLRQTALAWKQPTTNHIPTCNAVAPLIVHKIASLPIAVPISMAAMISPVLGNTKLHQLRWKFIWRKEHKVATSDIQKKKRESDQRKMATKTARSLRTWAVGRPDVPRMKVWGKMIRASFAISINASAVNDGGPTAMNIPGRVSGEGRPNDIKRPT